eukprot:758493-Hanusia_phi.AAC.3
MKSRRGGREEKLRSEPSLRPHVPASRQLLGAGKFVHIPAHPLIILAPESVGGAARPPEK